MPLAPGEYTLGLSLGPNETSKEQAAGNLDTITAVTVAPPASAGLDLPSSAVSGAAGARRPTVAEDAAAKQAKMDELRRQTAEDTKKLGNTYQQMVDKDPSNKDKYQARRSALEKLGSQLVLRQPQPIPSGIVPSTSIYGQLGVVLRQTNPRSKELGPYFDVAKALLANQASAAKVVEKAEAAGGAAGAVAGIFANRQRANAQARADQTKANLQKLQDNYNEAKMRADPKIDALVDAVNKNDFFGISAAFANADSAGRQQLINRRASNGDTPMHAAAMNGDAFTLGFLHDMGATVDPTDPEGRTPLIRAVEAREADAAMMLLSLGANLSARPLPREAGVNPPTATELAKANKDLRMAAVLDRRTKLVQVPMDADPITAAAVTGDVNQLLSSVEDHNPNPRDAFGWTPLHHAVASGQGEAIRLLADAHADLNATTITGRSPLTLAIEKDQPLAVLALLRAGADPKRKDANGDDAAGLAKTLNRPDLVTLVETAHQ